ncbi:MAG: hypothetical protein KAT04_12185 [Methylococcales bacterium]|nr:hypothetical protein [Methylococcales bacterium]
MVDVRNHIEELIREAIRATKEMSSALVQAYAMSNVKQIDTYLPLFYEALMKLEIVYPATTRPIWISGLKQLLKTWGENDANNENIRRAVFQQLLRFHKDIEELQIESILLNPIINFDSIVNEAVEEFKVDELYTEAISRLRGLIASGRIDSIKIRNDLQGLLDTLLVAEKSSYQSKVSTAQFVQTYFKHLGKEVLTGTKCGKAFLNTLDELGISVENVIGKVHEKLEVLAKEKAIELKEDLRLLEAPED